MFATQCFFTVHHPDSVLDNPFRLVIEGSYGESDLFQFNNVASTVDPEYSRVYELMLV